MRPQSFASLAPTPPLVDDLGWNDMGDDVAAFDPAEAGPAVAPTPIAPTIEPDVDAPTPSVLVARDALREQVEAAAEPAPAPLRAVKTVSIATAGRLQRETMHLHRAAFTLRLDADRHLRLRLASAVTHRSAQQLVLHALDQFLATLPEVDTLVRQLPPPPAPKRKR